MAYPDSIKPESGDGGVLSLKKIGRILWEAATGATPLTVTGGSGGGSVTPVPTRTTSSPVTIPANSKGWGFMVYTGTATMQVGGGAAVPFPTASSYFEDKTTAAAITITPGSSSDVFVTYNS